MCRTCIYFIGVFMSRYTFAFTKEKKQNFIPNGDQTRYVEITGCPIESVNGTYYQMDPITINDKTYNLCFTNGVYLLESIDLWTISYKCLYELDNSSLIRKFECISNIWYEFETSLAPAYMNVSYFGDWHRRICRLWKLMLSTN